MRPNDVLTCVVKGSEDAEDAVIPGTRAGDVDRAPVDDSCLAR